MYVQRLARVQAVRRLLRLHVLAAAVFVVSALSSGCASKEEAPSPVDPTGPGIDDPVRPKRPLSEPVYGPMPPGARPRNPGGGPSSHRPEAPETPLAAVAEVTGGRVSSDVIARIVSENLERFRPCATTDAKIELRLTLGPAGSVASAESPRSQPDDPRLRDCAVDAALSLRFPRDPGSDVSVVVFELVLTKPAF